MDTNIVEIWLRRDPIRWMAGVLGGFFAGIVALLVAMVLSVLLGWEALFPLKLMGAPLLGPTATDVSSVGGAIAGFLLTQAIAVFYGFVFAHFTGTNSVRALFLMGLAWGAFTWIFIWNLFLPSFKAVFAAGIPAGPAFPVCMAYGIALCSVSFFDQFLRSKKS